MRSFDRLESNLSYVSGLFLAFVAAVIVAYFLVPKKGRWIVLLLASYTFFFLNSEWVILVLVFQTLVTYLCGLWIERIMTAGAQKAESLSRKEARALKKQTKSHSRKAMAVGIVFNLATLLYLKYWNFFVDVGNSLLAKAGIQLPHALGLVLPVGISFYTLQAIAYLSDITRNKTKADHSLPKFMLFMSYFPQILQGPIPRHSQLAKQLYEGHRFDYKRLCYGSQLILWGFIKKLVIANRLAIPVDQLFDNASYYTGPILFLASVGYGLQVYADFSGGMDISLGISQILGIQLADNFKQPYFSNSVEDFWRRWHITLGQWMRDYVFYPLNLSKAFARIGKKTRAVFGTSAGKKIPPFMAMFIVYLLVGFWHGSSWKYVAYGLWNSIFISMGILLVDQYAAMRKLFRISEDSKAWLGFQIFRTFIVCSIGRYFSRAASLSVALNMMKNTFVGWYDFSFITDGSLINLGLSNASWFVLVIALIVLFAVDYGHERGVSFRDTIARQGIVLRWAIYLLAIAIPVVFGVYGSGYNASAFIYQQF